MPLNNKVILCHNGGCLSPRLLVGFNGSTSDLPKDVQLSEDVILDYISDNEAESCLQGSTKCILYMERGSQSPMCLAYRLDDRLFRQELRERGQELKQLGRPINTPDGQIRWRVLMPGPRLLHVQRLTRVLVPHVAQLIADAEAHPGFTKAMPNGEQLHSRLLDVNPLIAPNAQGIFICLLSSAGQPVHAMITVSMKAACLQLTRMDDSRHSSHVASLQDALGKLPELAATHTPHKPRQPAVYSLHADTCGIIPIVGDALDASLLGPVHQHHMQQRSPLSRVLHGTAKKSNRVAPLADEPSPGTLTQAPHRAQLPAHAANTGAQLRPQLQGSVSSAEAAQKALESPPKASAAAAEPLPSSPCRSPFARTSQEQEREKQHIERALEQIRVARGLSELWAGLRQLKADRATAKSGWADEWISHEALEAMVIWAANQDGVSAMDSSAMGKAVSREAAALVTEASNESAAARRLAAQMGATLAQRLPSMALLQLFLDLVEIPAVKQAAASGTLAEKLAAHLEALWPVCDVVAALDRKDTPVQHAQSRSARPGAPRRLSLSPRKRSPTTIGDNHMAERASTPSSPSQSWRESPRLEGIMLAKPGCKPVFVPKLALPALASPKDPGANSRGSRLGLSSQGSGAFAVTPLQRLLSPSFLTPDNTFRLPTEHAQESACARLTALGRHVGSGLMAADMAAMLAQKRQESLARAEALAPRLSLPLKNLTAHRIEILTDRSMSDSPVKAEEHSDAGQRSAQSSPVKMSPLRASVARRLNMSHTPSSLSAARAGPPPGEEEQGHLPSMLMQSLLSARSAASGCKASPSLAKAVTSQLLTLCRGRDSESAQQKELCMALLETCTTQWQDPRDMLQTSAWRSNNSKASQHVLFPAIAHELRTACQLYAQGMPLPALERAEKLLGLAQQFLERAASPALPDLAQAHLAKPLSQLSAMLAGMGPFSDWHAAAKGVLNAQLQLSALMLERCKDASLGRRLISWALQDPCVAPFKSRVFTEAAAAAQAGPRGKSSVDICCSFANYYTALAELLSRQPGWGQAEDDPSPGSEEDEDGFASPGPCARGAEVLVSSAAGPALATGAALTRRRALAKLAFLVELPNGVIACMLGQAPPAAGQQACLQTMAALRLLRAVLGAPGNPFVSDWALVDFYGQYHFLHFARLFHDLPGGGAPLTSLCKAHLQVLRAMAGSKSKAVRQQFMQLHVLDMLVRELSLEYEAQQIRPPAAPCLTSSTSSSAGDFSAEAASCAASPALSLGGMKIPRLHLSPAPSATAAELRGIPAMRLSPAPSGAAKVPPLRLSPAPSAGPVLESRAGSAIGQPSRSGSCGKERKNEQAGRLATLNGAAPLQAPGMPQKVPALNLPGRLKASKPPLGSSRATPRMQLTARSTGGLLGSARPSSAPLGSARSSPTGPLTAAMPRLGRTVSAAAALAQSAESPSRRSATAAPHVQQLSSSGQITPRQQVSWRGKAVAKVPSSPFAANIVADSRSPSADVVLLHTSCATVPERSDEADQDTSPVDSPEDAQSKPPALAAAQQSPVPPLRLDNLPPESEDESCGSDADSDAEATAEAQDGDAAAGNAGNGLGIELTGDADEDVRRMMALEGYDSDSSSYSSDDGSMDGDVGFEPETDGTTGAVPVLDLTASMRLSQRSSEHTPTSQGDSGNHPGQLGRLEKLAQGKGKMQAAQQHSHAPDVAPLLMRSYLDQRAKRLLYADKDLHVLVLDTVLELLLSEHGQLDAAYCCLQPLEQRRQNVLYMLGHHLNHPANAAVTAPLLERAAKIGQPAVRLLRILCARLFSGEKYLQQKRIARGAYAEVFSCSFTEAGRQENVVLKVMDMPRSIHDSCRQVDVFSEIAVLERFKGRPGMCQLLDYGLDGDDFIMVLRHYSGSLKSWRAQMPGCPDGQLRLYLQIFRDIVSSVQDLEAEQVVHFDLKCDNILLEALEAPTDPAALPFRVVLSDFGESRMYASTSSALTVRNRGTEYMKSPEMLVVGNATNQTRSNHDRRRREGAGTPADVWALGCLLYELLTGRILFYDPDWIRFFIRLTQSKEDIIPADRMAAVAHLPGVEKLLRCMLVRDPARRATLADISRRVQKLLESVPVAQHIPEASLPAAMAPSRSDSTGTRLQPSGSNASAIGISAQYSLAEHYLDAFTPVAERLLLGSVQGLERAHRLADHRISHAIILCCGPEDDGGSSHRRHTHAGHNPEWLQGDTMLAAATASCVAADVKCKVIPIGPLPSSQASASSTAEQGLLRAMPAILRLISSALNEHASCESPCWDSAGSPSRAPHSSQPFPGQTLHHTRIAQQEPGNVLLAAAAGYEGEAAVATIAHIMRQQRLSPYDATLAARYQHSALHLQEHNERQLSSWASFAVSPGQAPSH